MRSIVHGMSWVQLIVVLLVGWSCITPALAQSGSAELDALDVRILELWGKQRFAETLPLHRRALAWAEKTFGADHPTTIKRVEDTGSILIILAHRDEARAMYERAAKARERMIASKKKGATPDDFAALASAYRYAEQFTKAEYLYKQVLDMQEKLFGPSDRRVAGTLFFIADLYNAQERYSEEAIMRKRELAIREVQRVDDPATQIPGMPSMVEFDTLLSINQLVSTYEILGRYADAEALARRHLAKLEKDPRMATMIPGGLSQIARVLAAQERYAEADKAFRRAIVLERAVSAKPALGVRNDFSLGYVLSDWADVLYKTGRLAEAEKAAAEALPLFRMTGKDGPDDPMTAEVITTQARIRQAQGGLEEAEKLHNRALAIIQNTGGPEHPRIAHILADLAGLKLAQGKSQEAYELARRGTTLLIRQVRRQTGTLTMTPTGQARPERLYYQPAFAAHLRTAADLAGRSPERTTQLAAEGFEIAQWAQHSQAAAALSQMAARFAKGEGELAELIRGRQDLVGSYKSMERILIAAMAKPAGQRNKAQEDKLHAASDDVQRRIEEIDAVLAKKFPDYAALATPEPLSIAEVQASLRPDEALFQLAIEDNQSFAWVVTRDGLRWQTLPVGTSALAKEVAALRCGLDASGWQVAAEPAGAQSANRCEQLLSARPGPDGALPFDLARSHALYKTLLSPFEDLIRNKHLLFIPSGPLTTLPPHVLVASAPDTALTGNQSYLKAAWLGVRQPVTVLPSVASLKSLRASARKSMAANPFAGFANPLLTGAKGTDRSAWARQSCASPGDAKAQVAVLTAPRGTMANYYRGTSADVDVIRRQSPLPETADEVCFVAKDLGAPSEAVYLGGNATEAKIKSLSASGALKSYRVLHFATHGLVAGETRTLIANRAEPALLLTPPQAASEEDDGLLTASEVAKLSLDADWVILSACNTAAADGAPGAEALSGLASAFLYAGTRSLIVSHWYVNSEAAVKLITGIFGELRKQPGIGRAEAMRRSISARIQEGGARTHPSYWAPFVIVGESG